MPKITMTTSAIVGDVVLSKGDDVDVGDETSDAMIADGLAVPFDEAAGDESEAVKAAVAEAKKEAEAEQKQAVDAAVAEARKAWEAERDAAETKTTAADAKKSTASSTRPKAPPKAGDDA